jgi:hypothetical protein
MKFCASTAIDLELLSLMAVKLWIKSVTTYEESSCRTRGVQVASKCRLSSTYSVTIVIMHYDVFAISITCCIVRGSQPSVISHGLIVAKIHRKGTML